METYSRGSVKLVNVPNVLLQDDWRLIVYAYDENHTKHEQTFGVVSRTRPDDYVYTQIEIEKWSELDARIDQIEDKGVSDEKIAEAVTGYLEENPIESPVESVNGKTGAVVLTAADVNALPADTEIPNVTGLATEDYVDKSIAKIEIPSIDGLATESYVDKKIKNVSVDLTGYATEEYVNEKIETIELTPGPAGKDGYTPVKGVDYFDGKDGQDYVLTDADKKEIAGMVEVSGDDTDLTDYYTKSEVDALIPDVSNFATKEEIPAAPDLSGYALKTDIPDVSDYQTAEDVQAAINTALGEIGVAEEGVY